MIRIDSPGLSGKGGSSLYWNCGEERNVDPQGIDKSLFEKIRDNPEEEALRKNIVDVLKQSKYDRPYNMSAVSHVKIRDRKFIDGLYVPINIAEAFKQACNIVSGSAAARKKDYLLLLATLIQEDEKNWEYFTKCHAEHCLVMNDIHYLYEPDPNTGRLRQTYQEVSYDERAQPYYIFGGDSASNIEGRIYGRNSYERPINSFDRPFVFSPILWVKLKF